MYIYTIRYGCHYAEDLTPIAIIQTTNKPDQIIKIKIKTKTNQSAPQPHSPHSSQHPTNPQDTNKSQASAPPYPPHYTYSPHPRAPGSNSSYCTAPDTRQTSRARPTQGPSSCPHYSRNPSRRICGTALGPGAGLRPCCWLWGRWRLERGWVFRGLPIALLWRLGRSLCRRERCMLLLGLLLVRMMKIKKMMKM